MQIFHYKWIYYPINFNSKCQICAIVPKLFVKLLQVPDYGFSRLLQVPDYGFSAMIFFVDSVVLWFREHVMLTQASGQVLRLGRRKYF